MIERLLAHLCTGSEEVIEIMQQMADGISVLQYPVDSCGQLVE